MMSRSGLLALAIAFGSFGVAECRAQVGFGAVQTFVNSGGGLGVTPVLTNSNRYARLGINFGVSELIDVQTFSPVQGYPGLVPTTPIGFGFGGLNPGSGLNGKNNLLAFRKPVASRFVDAAWKFDKDKNARLDRAELEKLTLAVVAELKQSPASYAKLKHGAQANRLAGTLVTEKDVTKTFLKQCLKFDRDQDGKLNPSETDKLAAALLKFLK